MCPSMSTMTMLLTEQKSLPKFVSWEDGGADLSGQGRQVVVQELKGDGKGQQFITWRLYL